MSAVFFLIDPLPHLCNMSIGLDFSVQDCYVLDGGLGTEVEKTCPDIMDDPLWSARLLHSNPKVLEEIHLDFLRNGADIIITASYQAGISLLSETLKIDEKQALVLISESVAIAKRARTRFLEEARPATGKEVRSPLIAGSVGPYGACLCDSSEYNGKYMDHVSREELKAWHRPRVAALLEAGVDLLAVETFPAQVEAEVMVDLLKEFPKARAWISFSCKDGQRTCHGELFSECVASVTGSPQILAVGINCTNPSHVSSLLRSAQGLSDKPFVIYPDGKDYWDLRSDLGPNPNPSRYPLDCIKEWRSLGAKVIGGCCHVDPPSIRRIKDTVNQK